MTSSATRIVLVRHGQTAWNADGRIQGHLDMPLNDHGHWQAQRTGEVLRGSAFDAVYSSDLQRARDTALALADGVPVVADAGLRERGFGEFEGLSFPEVEARWPEAARRWRQRDPSFGPPGGEVLAEFYERAVRTAARLALAHAGQHIALVSHGGVLDCLYRAATGLALDAPRSWVLGNAAINRLLHHGEGFSLVGWNDAAHLDRDTP